MTCMGGWQRTIASLKEDISRGDKDKGDREGELVRLADKKLVKGAASHDERVKELQRVRQTDRDRGDHLKKPWVS